MTALLQFLNSICPLSEGLQNYLTANLVRIEIPKKDFILKKGHNWFDIYFIQKGLLYCILALSRFTVVVFPELWPPLMTYQFFCIQRLLMIPFCHFSFFGS